MHGFHHYCHTVAERDTAVTAQATLELPENRKHTLFCWLCGIPGAGRRDLSLESDPTSAYTIPVADVTVS